MERLTEWRNGHGAIVNNRENYIDKLARYEDAEEQGRLIVLPCALGETVYRISHQQDSYDGIDRTVILQHPFSCEDLSQIGKRVFLSREEAEKALEGMK